MVFTRLTLAVAIVIGSVDPDGSPAHHQQPADLQIAAAIRAELPGGSTPAGGLRTSAEQAELTSLYAGERPALLWVDTGGRPSGSARDALTLLQDAGAEGLDPGHYDGAQLARRAAALEHAALPPPANMARFDVGLSAGILRYLRHLHHGRIDPRAIGFRLRVPADRHDFAAALRSALADRDIPGTAAAFTPSFAQYGALKRMLPYYRALAADRTDEPLPAIHGSVRPGDRYAGVSVLHGRLVAFGDLAEDAPAPSPSTVYDGPLVDGVMRFQMRHGLEPDGVIGKATHAALDVPLTWRVRQIELALERLRWLPHWSGQRLVTLNIPMFRLWAWDAAPAGALPALAMDVIVGRALSTQTPVFVEEMDEIIFRPYWNVPRSILLAELLPLIKRDPGYVVRQNMEIVRGPGDTARSLAATPETVALLGRGVLRLRQRPGPDNALGLIKFVFPNAESVYMHGTPAQALFSRRRRDFSHGCVRLADPVALARWVLEEQPEWTEARILAAMDGPASRHVPLRQPIVVILFYTTAAVLPDAGVLHFAEDIYRHDAKLDRALARVTVPRS